MTQGNASPKWGAAQRKLDDQRRDYKMISFAQSLGKHLWMTSAPMEGRLSLWAARWAKPGAEAVSHAGLDAPVRAMFPPTGVKKNLLIPLACVCVDQVYKQPVLENALFALGFSCKLYVAVLQVNFYPRNLWPHHFIEADTTCRKCICKQTK